jgi:hypothetical protein
MTGNLPFWTVFDFQRALVPVRSMRRLSILGNYVFKVQLGGMFEHLLPVAGQMLGVDDGQFDAVLT